MFKKRPKFSIVALALFVTVFILAGIYLIYQIFAATTITKTFWIMPNMQGGYIKNVLPDGSMGTNVNCPGDCTGTYTYSSTGTLTYKAIPKSGWRFKKWIHGTYSTTTNPIKLDRTHNQTWTAQFEQVTTASTTTITTSSTTPGSTDDLRFAQSVINYYITACPILTGTVAEFGDTYGYQAISLGASKKIRLNPNHTVDTRVLIDHEIWHIYDYVDNGRMDWGESVPPRTKPACWP